MKILFVDLEIIARDDGEEIEKIIEKIEYKASDKYLKNIASLYSSGEISEEEYRVFIEEGYDYKDRVLEEVEIKYKNKINFRQIYEINDSNKNMVDYIERISNSIETYIIFYYNTDREYLEKIEICKKHFPKCKVMGIKFYQRPYNKNYQRKRTNKASYIKEQLGFSNLEGCMLIDKSARSCDEWNALLGDATLYRKRVFDIKKDEESHNVLRISK